MYVNFSHYHLKNILLYVFIILMVLSISIFSSYLSPFINGFLMALTRFFICQFKSVYFRYFLSDFSFYHSLQIVNAVYRPQDGYLSGFLLWITEGWIRWKFVTFFVVFTISVILIYRLCRYFQIMTKTTFPRLFTV